MMRRLVTASVALLTALFAAVPGAARAQGLEPDAVAGVAARLETEIRRVMLEGGIPSVTIALTDRAGELWSGGYGESNLWARTPASAAVTTSCTGAVRARNHASAWPAAVASTTS